MNGPELRQLIYGIADEYGLPRELVLALAQAESGCNSDAERWYSYTREAKEAIAANDTQRLQTIVDSITNYHHSDDISFGCMQQTWRWSDEYAQQYGKSLVGRNDLAAIMDFRSKYLDPEVALRNAAPKLVRILARPDVQGDILMALYKWNRAAVGVMPPPGNQLNYQRSLEQAQKWIEEDAVSEDQPVPEHSFQFGFENKANELGAEIVGEPVEDEREISEHHTVQTTTTGVMWFQKESGVVHFLEGL